MSSTALRKVIAREKIKKSDLSKAINFYRREICKTKYLNYRDRLGHDPTTTELESEKPERGARALYARIMRYWPSFNSFRAELKIPVPRLGNPKFIDDVRPALQQRQMVQKLRRDEITDKILGAIAEAGAMTTIELSLRLSTSDQMIRKLLRQLQARGLIKADGIKPIRYSIDEE